MLLPVPVPPKSTICLRRASAEMENSGELKKLSAWMLMERGEHDANSCLPGYITARQEFYLGKRAQSPIRKPV